ncbi:TonB-dependent receptor [Nibribacter ruber]|uniref:TonB-dependent receptor n=1 Tax=Nibribacter ruber TaxID=2698458 RepID=A0A6P1P432_9BACT|nr:TonB-dependent receptor [Nibribacter ruber]QHL89143.1 TonB-dependent receptor [Nibribacter ruber]
MKKYIQLLVGVLLSFTAAAQSGQVRGRVFDAYSKTPLVGATVILSSTQGATTDAKGEFSLDCSGVTPLTVKFVGYETFNGSLKICDQYLQIGLTPSNTNLNEVEVSAASSETNTVLRQPQSIGLLTRRELSRSEGLFLESSLNLMPGVRMEKRTMNGGQRILIRGYGLPAANGNQLNFNGAGYKAYLNGIPVTDAEGVTVLDDVDFSTLGKVEVVKGPASSLYGTGIGGVVKMFTLRPEAQTTRLVQEGVVGSYGLWSTNTRLESANERASILVNYGHQNYDSYRVHTSSKKDFATFVGDFRSSDKQSISVYAAYNNSFNAMAGQLDSASFFNKENEGEAKYLENNGRVSYESFRSGLSHTYAFTDFLSNTSSAYFNNYTQEQASAAGLNSNMAYNLGGRTEFNFNFANVLQGLTGTVGGEYQKTISFRKTNALGAGGTLGGITADLEVSAMQYSAFTEWNLQLPLDFTLIAGLSANRVEYGITDKLTNSANPTHADLSGYKKFDAVVTPRAALQKLVTPNVTAYASVSQGYSPPSATTVVVPQAGRVLTNLKPEQGTQYEVGSKGSLLDKKLSYQVALFHLKVQDKIMTQAYADPQSGSILYTISANGGEQTNQGLEVALNYSLLQREEGLVTLVKPFLNYTYSDFTYDQFTRESIVKVNNVNTRVVTDYSGQAVIGVPKQNFNAGVDVELKLGFYLYTTFQHVDDMPITYDAKYRAPSYNLLNAKLGWRKNLGNHVSLDVFAGGNNLTGDLYYNMVFLDAYSSSNNPNIYLPAAYKPTYFGGLNFGYKF